jgi:NTP pyrophosphatase (non-canonical NTP hydrolase)
MRKQIKRKNKMAQQQNQTTYDGLVELANNVYELGEALTRSNDFGQSIGDELHDIAYQFSRIADALEKIANK